MEEWKTYKLRDVIKLSSGGTPSKSVKSYWNGTIPWISARQMYCDFINASDTNISIEGLANGSKLAPTGSTLLLTRGSGLFNHIPVCLVLSPVAYNQDVKCILPKDETLLSKEYLFYCLYGKKKEISEILETTGIGAGKIDTDRFLDLTIQIPNLRQQELVLIFVSSIFDKIELNNRINHNLEEQAQALYKSWFVDFEPFKDGKFVESELGMIPEGWRVLPAESICPINIGKTPPRSEHTWFSSDKQNITWVSISDMGNAGCFINSSAETLTKEAVEKFNIKVVPPGSILLSFKLTIGRVAIAGKELTSNEAIARFEASDYQRSFLFLTLKSYDYSSLGSTSSIATAVNSKIIKSMPIICPTDKIMTDFHFLTKDIFTEIQIRQEETSRLSELRDSLLPKLMSGELKINEIDC